MTGYGKQNRHAAFLASGLSTHNPIPVCCRISRKEGDGIALQELREERGHSRTGQGSTLRRGRF